MIVFQKKRAAVVTLKEIDRILTAWAKTEFEPKAKAKLEEGSECDVFRIVLRTQSKTVSNQLTALYQKYLNRAPESWELMLVGGELLLNDELSMAILAERLDAEGIGFKPDEFLWHPAEKPEILVLGN